MQGYGNVGSVAALSLARYGAKIIAVSDAFGGLHNAKGLNLLALEKYVEVKKTVVGAGHADKNQIQVMLKMLLPKADPKTPDAADALAIAITHAHHRQSAMLKLKVASA